MNQKAQLTHDISMEFSMEIKFTRLCLVAALSGAALAMSACSSSSSGSSTNSSDTAIPMTLIQGIAGDEFYISVACGAKAKAQELGVTLDVQGGQKWDATAQTAILNAAIAKSPAAIMIAANDTTGMVPTLKQASQAGIKLVAFDQIIPQSGVVDAQVASDSVEGGKLAAQEMVRQMGETGKVLVVSLTPAIPGGEQRAQGFEDEMKNHPGITVLPRQYSDNDPVKAASIVSATLASNPDLKGVFAVNLMSGEGSATALKEAGKSGTVKLVAADASPSQVTALEDGSVQALIAQKPFEEGQVAVQQAYNAVKGQPVTPMTSTGWVTVTKDNMNDPDVNKYLYKADCS